MSNSYDEFTRKHRRLSILRILAVAPGYSSNDSLLTVVVNDFGIVSTRDQVRSDVTWLKDQGFVTTRDTAGVLVVTLTEAGGEVAAGRRGDPGIAKPSPKG